MKNHSLATRFVLIFLTLLLLSGCGNPLHSSAKEAPAATPALPASHPFTFILGGQTLKVEVVVSTPEMQTGLMYRKELAPDAAMLFVFPNADKRSFWMKNTLIPLDVGYFDSSLTLREIHPLFPHHLDPVYSASSGIQFALETNQGWFRQHGIKPGATLDRSTVRDALLARGFNPGAFGL